ncbi:hypothetical protein H7849_00715 [Alloacidobacterium dinghuense]|uniref:Uncharacterized protein n=1 Tax=Alloacidobacterium dinghuense TaxID=2763107 RepID=A0A7G8BQ89_9BACT|nr:hypothetical protein H7849_00715 [Alloacidobacterium dinghuense]
MQRRDFLKLLASIGAGSAVHSGFGFALETSPGLRKGEYSPGRIPNEFSLFLPGEEDALRSVPTVSGIQRGELTAKAGTRSAAIRPGEMFDGWQLITISDINGVTTAVFEKHVTHRGAIAYVTEQEGMIAWIPKFVGSLAKIRPRPTNTPHGVKLERAARYVPGPDVTGLYLLNSSEDPCYENVAALGAEYIGWTLVANEQGGPKVCLYLEPDGKSREIAGKPDGDGSWEQDQLGAYFDPAELLSDENPKVYEYTPGYSKRALLGGYLPVADIGVWNPQYQCGYETMLLLPPGTDAKPLGRVRVMIPEDRAGAYSSMHAIAKDADGRSYVDRYWNCSPESFYAELAGIWNRWSSLYETAMQVRIPDEWLLNAARASITLSRCSYRGLEPTYQIGEGAYTKIPERSHALFPVAEYEFIWAQQIWNLTDDADAYYQYYLEKYVLPNGDFVYNTQDQVEAPLNVGVFLANSARSYDYSRNLDALQKRLPILDRMIAFVLRRYEYSKEIFSPGDRRYGLIYGSPEADLGDPNNDFPKSHPLYYQNSAWIWRGLNEHARCLALAAQAGHDESLIGAATRYAGIATEMRANIQASLEATLSLRTPEMKAAGISPFTPDDIHRRPTELASYENHRFMQDWFLADWGDPALDLGHLKHRELAGMQILGLHTDGAEARTSNFMDHGSLAVKIRQEDYRPFLLNLYALVCYAADSGNRYAPEDALIPGSFAGEGNRYGWASVINSTLQPSVGLRWLLCYEESDKDVCHLQKAAPKHWFAAGETIAVAKCPTRFGPVSWSTRAISDRQWKVMLDVPKGFTGDIIIHIHPRDGKPVQTASVGTVVGNGIVIPRATFGTRSHFELDVS